MVLALLYDRGYKLLIACGLWLIVGDWRTLGSGPQAISHKR